ncbi:MAG: hypothetical protein U0793_05400 [Gemmataceae bacterium]
MRYRFRIDTPKKLTGCPLPEAVADGVALQVPGKRLGPQDRRDLYSTRAPRTPGRRLPPRCSTATVKVDAKETVGVERGPPAWHRRCLSRHRLREGGRALSAVGGTARLQRR